MERRDPRRFSAETSRFRPRSGRNLAEIHEVHRGSLLRAPAIQGGLDAESHVAGTGSESEPTRHLERRGDGPERDLTSFWRTMAGAD